MAAPVTPTVTSPWALPDLTRPVRFPDTFRWGAATAAYQIEGAAWTDGRTDSIWDAFARVPGAVVEGHDGAVACDHYHRYPADVALMRELGIGTYRFSTSWARVRPDGGAVNPAGVDFYSRLVDSLLEAGITPWLTLYHWDLPQAVEDEGGWTNRDVVGRFVEYGLTLHEALGDRVRHWTTLNEPWCSAFLGYGSGAHAPGRTDDTASIRAMHHLLLAHGETITALRSADPGATLGITLNSSVFSPADPSSPDDVDAARRLDGLQTRIFADPIFRGSYPDDMRADLAPSWPDDLVRDGDLAAISAPIDVLGLNYYTASVVRAPALAAQPSPPGPGGGGGSPWIAARDVEFLPTDVPRTGMGWEVHPGAFRDLLVRLHTDYTGPAGAHLVITENGAAYDDLDRDASGAVVDDDRIDYLNGHLRAVAEAIEAGADVRGYLVWSLMDNFEWALGYTKRFGIVHVDYETLERTPKASARWFAALATTGALAP